MLALARGGVALGAGAAACSWMGEAGARWSVGGTAEREALCLKKDGRLLKMLEEEEVVLLLVLLAVLVLVLALLVGGGSMALEGIPRPSPRLWGRRCRKSGASCRRYAGGVASGRAWLRPWAQDYVIVCRGLHSATRLDLGGGEGAQRRGAASCGQAP
jgi:hypothetical protein